MADSKGEGPAAGSHLLSFLLAGKSVRGVILDGTSLVQELRKRQGTGILETQLLGQALQAIVLMASSLKGHDEIGLRIDCPGPVKGLVAEATGTGEVRGYLKQGSIPLAFPLTSFDEISGLNPWWGDGFLTINRYLQGGREPFSCKMALQSGNLASELAHYYHISEQIPTAIHLSVFFDLHGEVSGAGGLFLQAMPGADEKIMATLEQTTQALPSLGQVLAAGWKTTPWVQEQFAPFHPEILEERPVHFRCRCNALRMRSLLLHLSLAELEEMRDNGPFPVQVSCHFCNEHYGFEQRNLAEICREKETVV